MTEPKQLADWLRDIWNMELYHSSEGHVVELNQVILALAIVLIGVIISKYLTSLLANRLRKMTEMTSNATYLVQKILHIILSVLVILVALPIAGIPITIFTVLGGALAIGVGFGAQNLFNNLISGFILMMERPIRIGDVLEVNNEEGRVMDIGNRCVRVRRSDGVDVLLPNSKFLEEPVINWTLFDNEVRGTVTVGVAYGSPVREVEKILYACADSHKSIHKTPKPTVLFTEFGDNALTFELLFWTRISRPMDRRLIESDLRFDINERMEQAGITIAFPQRDVHLDTLKPLDVRVLRGSQDA